MSTLSGASLGQVEAAVEFPRGVDAELLAGGELGGAHGGGHRRKEVALDHAFVDLGLAGGRPQDPHVGLDYARARAPGQLAEPGAEDEVPVRPRE
jgi:hypothetical protein